MPPLLPVMQRLMETKHHKEQLGSHYYLAYIGTDPVSQGKGYGTALLHHVLRRSTGTGVLRDNQSPKPIALLPAWVNVIEELIWPGGGPSWPMWPALTGDT